MTRREEDAREVYARNLPKIERAEAELREWQGRRYVIECRRPDGSLDFSGPQPESHFGMAAIHGITEGAMADAVFRHFPEDGPQPDMRGDNIESWPALVDPRWRARRRTW